MGKINSKVSYYDKVTGLPGISILRIGIARLLRQRNHINHFAVVHIDIDNFKYINEVFGHAAGNIFLKYMACNIKTSVGKFCLVVRLTGDEFVVLFKNVRSKALLIKELEKLYRDICQPWAYLGHELYIGTSIGAALYPDGGENATSLIRAANIAMETAKKEGAEFFIYKEGQQEEVSNYLEITSDIQKGLNKNEFILYYQPQYNLHTGKILGIEALVRWNHPNKGILPPSMFIPTAEKSKQIYELEKIIFKNALTQMENWEKEEIKLDLSINLSSKTLGNDQHFKEIENILYSAKVNFSRIIIEITETALLMNTTLASERLIRLKKIGVQIALDDFGTGFSSFTHIKRLPIDIIKIDRSFVEVLSDKGRESLLVKHIISLANDLQCKVVAEGIENQKQLDILKSFSCECGQGYLFSMPMPFEKISKLSLS